ncbi:hypothetical protein [Primorskyibacter flagellatus]|uniref:VPLPA-CTERM protein sorting domain-containing protein n=1 Tax=Primorskyibacter flagellatus TaxID=1387277 RepID=A0A1W2EQT7_9RHOB|nr:hypothetical protein [Primorskyibacter flagellatus]SMD11488.1 hypothetical protein SAMN06295998_13516 [Primorskyibacter flagellatus]
MFRKFLLPLIFLAVPCTAIASTVNINLNSGGEYYQSLYGIRDDTVTRGGDLAGMIVTASYVDGTTDTVTFGATWGAWGQANGSGFEISLEWKAFELSVTKSLKSLSLDTRAASAVFDASTSTRLGDDTYGTKVGYAFSVFGDYDPEGVIDVNYSQAFVLAGHERAPDTYTRLSIDFSGLEGGGLSRNLQFRSDLDSLAVSGDLSSVPLPASLLLFASAFGIMRASVARKRTAR